MQRLLIAAAVSVLPLWAYAARQDIKLEHIWARAAGPGQNSALYMTVTVTGSPDFLTGVSTPVAQSAELHQSSHEQGVMQMRPVGRLPVGPDAPLRLEPGGYHVMLVGLKQALKPGDSMPVTVTFEKGGPVEATAKIAPAGATKPPPGV
ncbi:MAG: copper chaperone PCu(A)C [Acetobacteraceae bacterium]|nr:copper chaperone PCu(A)C [Acetobacteraceae bacterium]